MQVNTQFANRTLPDAFSAINGTTLNLHSLFYIDSPVV